MTPHTPRAQLDYELPYRTHARHCTAGKKRRTGRFELNPMAAIEAFFRGEFVHMSEVEEIVLHQGHAAADAAEAALPRERMRPSARPRSALAAPMRVDPEDEVRGAARRSGR